MNKKKPMDAARAAELFNLAIAHAKFDRKRFKVRARESADGTRVDVYADAIQLDENGRTSTNYNPIHVEHITDDIACAEQLRMVVESMVEGLDDFLNSEVKPDGREEDRTNDGREN